MLGIYRLYGWYEVILSICLCDMMQKKKINLTEDNTKEVYLLDIFLHELVKIKVKNLWNSRSNNISNKNMDVGYKNNVSALTYKSFTL